MHAMSAFSNVSNSEPGLPLYFVKNSLLPVLFLSDISDVVSKGSCGSLVTHPGHHVGFISLRVERSALPACFPTRLAGQHRNSGEDGPRPVLASNVLYYKTSTTLHLNTF